MEYHSASIGVLVVGVGFIAEQHTAAIHAEPRAHLAGIVRVASNRFLKTGDRMTARAAGLGDLVNRVR